VPPALSWALLAYAAVAVAAGCAFAVLRVHSDYLQVMQDEGDSLRGVTAALTSATQAMLDNGMGAARAAASEIRAGGGYDRLAGRGVGLALQRHLTGGTFVRSLFLVENGHYVLAGRTHVFEGASLPQYLAGLEGADDVWVGAPMHDPQDPNHWVVPIARPQQTGPGASGWVGALLSFTGLEQLKQRFGDVVSLQGLVGLDGTILASVGGTTLALALVHDVTARKSAEEELRRVTAELLRLQDEERRRIGRDLHDSTGQSLAALEIDLAQLGRETAKLSPEGRAQLEHCMRLARQCSAEIRTASYLLHPPLLDELGLSSALRWLADGLKARGGLDVRLQLPEQLPGVTPAEELALFRVAQEALTNVQRHSSSPWVAIRLRAEPGSLVLEIEDAGRGMPAAPTSDAESSGRFTGVGVAGMRERIRQLGGNFDVESTAGGTLVRACIPLSGRPNVDRDAERRVAS
jgi:signal transduction histidine kinase